MVGGRVEARLPGYVPPHTVTYLPPDRVGSRLLGTTGPNSYFSFAVNDSKEATFPMNRNKSLQKIFSLIFLVFIQTRAILQSDIFRCASVSRS